MERTLVILREVRQGHVNFFITVRKGKDVLEKVEVEFL